jgi:hypothetical protein
MRVFVCFLATVFVAGTDHTDGDDNNVDDGSPYATEAAADEDCGCGGNSLTRDLLEEEVILASTAATPATFVRAWTANNDDEIALSEMVPIPGGRFTMGTDDPKIYHDHEHPARPVTVSPFMLERTEVSNAQFARFVAETNFTSEAEVFAWSFVFQLQV